MIEIANWEWPQYVIIGAFFVRMAFEANYDDGNHSGDPWWKTGVFIGLIFGWGLIYFILIMGGFFA